MHELALMESVVESIEDQVTGVRVVLVRLEIGALSGVAIDALRFSFDVCTQGTVLEGAELDIIEIPARARCHRCGAEQRIETYASACSCGSFDRTLVCGDELRLKEVEVH